VNDRLLFSDVRQARERLGLLGRWYASRPKGTAPEELEALIAADRDLERAGRTARINLVVEVDRRAGPFDARLLSALLDVPRERFVRPVDIPESALDTPLLLDDEGLATISAPHAYLLSFRVLGLRPGDSVAELGTGAGYGAALASHVVSSPDHERPLAQSSGSVVSVEIDEPLAARATRLLAGYANVKVLAGDAAETLAAWRGADRITVTFALDEIPEAWLEAIPEGGRMVAPVGRDSAQRLLRVDRVDGELVWSDHGAVRYVRNRGREPRVEARRS
jgi:protein-L-isoaspartate(D-aspartate) O-methyltransferase